MKQLLAKILIGEHRVRKARRHAAPCPETFSSCDWPNQVCFRFEREIDLAGARGKRKMVENYSGKAEPGETDARV